ncbi:hypothetical protein DsansV1_C08g0079461 [Dioscorea sansibarensis]
MKERWIKLPQGQLHHVSQRRTRNFCLNQLRGLNQVSLQINKQAIEIMNYISKICIPEKAANVMLPCLLRNQTVAADQNKRHRILSAAGSAASTCPSVNFLPNSRGFRKSNVIISILR